MNKNEGLSLLLVEDNPGDVLLIKRSLKPFLSNNTLITSNDGEQALHFLLNGIQKSQLPHIILLDLNLPKIDGRELLNKIKTNHSLNQIPVVIFTSSETQSDIKYAFENSVNAYIKKPFQPKEFTEVVHSFGEFWLMASKLPNL